MQRHYAAPNVPFSLGRVGEHLAREIVFDLRRWKKLYGEGEAQLMARRVGETVMYAVPLLVDGDTAIWRVANTDNAVPGEDGECELRYILEDGTLAKSEVWTVSVQQSMNYETSDPPVEARPWMDTLNEHIENVMELEEAVKETAEQAAASAGVAVSAEDAAAQSEKNSAASERNAAASEENAKASESAAAKSAQNAAASEEVAAESAKNAATSEENAKASESAAAKSAESAGSAATTAKDSADNASNCAEQAAGSVERIENMAVEAVTLDPGSAATVTKEQGEDAVKLVFGMPEGKPGYTPRKGVDYVDGQSVEHYWDGTNLILSSASGTSVVDLQGERGESGVTAPVNGFFTLSVDADGNLWAISAEEGTPLSFEYDSETGDLYIIQEVE